MPQKRDKSKLESKFKKSGDNNKGNTRDNNNNSKKQEKGAYKVKKAISRGVGTRNINDSNEVKKVTLTTIFLQRSNLRKTRLKLCKCFVNDIDQKVL